MMDLGLYVHAAAWLNAFTSALDTHRHPSCALAHHSFMMQSLAKP